VPRGTVLMDAGYGDEAAMRDRLSAQGLPYAVGIRPQMAVWWGDHHPAPAPIPLGRGRPRTRVRRDTSHQPIGVLELAQSLPASSYGSITWREGTNAPLCSRFARVRVRAAQGDRPRAEEPNGQEPGFYEVQEEWLLIEWPEHEAEPTHYWLSTLPPDVPFQDLVATVKMRWRIERDYCELKQELGLGHYEGCNWRGFHHHASLCIAAYGFLMLERLSGIKKRRSTPSASPTPKLPPAWGSPRCSATFPGRSPPCASPQLPLGSGYCQTPSPMSMLW
jgi:SRSO17 transposase